MSDSLRVDYHEVPWEDADAFVDGLLDQARVAGRGEVSVEVWPNAADEGRTAIVRASYGPGSVLARVAGGLPDAG